MRPDHVAWMLAILGFAAVGLGVIMTGLLLYAWAFGRCARGRVVRFESDHGADGSISVPIVFYQVGTEIFETKAIPSQPTMYRLGEVVDVYYPESRPDLGRVVMGREWLRVVTYLAVALIFFAAAWAWPRL